MPFFGVHLKRPQDSIKLHGPGLAKVVNQLSTVAKVSTLMLRKKAVTPSTEPSSLPPPPNVFVQPKAMISCTAPHISFQQ